MVLEKKGVAIHGSVLDDKDAVVVDDGLDLTATEYPFNNGPTTSLIFVGVNRAVGGQAPESRVMANNNGSGLRGESYGQWNSERRERKVLTGRARSESASGLTKRVEGISSRD